MDCNSPAVADRCVEALMRRFPDSLRVSRLKGMLLEAKGWYNQADNVYSSLLVEHPTEAVLHKRRVAMLKAKGDLVGAVDALKEYLDIFMADHDAWRELADIYITLQMLKQAAFCYEELLLSQPTNCLYTLTYAEILYTIGGPDNVRSARKFFAAAAEYSGGKNTRALYGICLCTAASSQTASGRGRSEKDTSSISEVASLVLQKEYVRRCPTKAKLVNSALQAWKVPLKSS
eukprot:SM000002S05656  [mRNA]  locus=s2:1463433:1465490:+ [translate_table: standard]